MQVPVLKDGVVVNVIELSEGTRSVDKATYNDIAAQDEAAHAKAMEDWRAQVQEHANQIQQAEAAAFMAAGMAAAAKADAKGSGADPQKMLDRVLNADAEAEAWRTNVADLKAKPAPAKPSLQRTKCWIVPDGHVVGEPGGNIGDVWDGKQYTPPDKPAPAPDKPAPKPTADRAA